MICNKVLIAGSPECQFVQNLYESAFPCDERRDFGDLLTLLRENEAFRAEVICDNEKPVGMLTYWTWKDWRYIEHFAIDKTCRGQGVGAAVLHSFVTSDNTPVVLEVEIPIDEMSVRRVGFYRRLGFILHENFTYIQPPYSPDRNAIELRLMTYGASADVQLESVATLLHREVYGVK